MTEDRARRDVVAAGRRLLAEGLVSRSWGNVSVRLDDRTVLLTPSGIPWNDVTESMLSLVDLVTGEWRGQWKPSGERKVHLEIYRRRPEVNAVVHTHQNAASVWAAARAALPGAEPTPCAPYALPGTKKLTRETVDALGAGSTVLLANHGVFAAGTDLDEAFRRVQALEKACADEVAKRQAALPGRVDAPWRAQHLSQVATSWGAAWLSAAPFTKAWADTGRRLPAVLDDLAQLAGTAVPVADQIPLRRPADDVVLLRGQGALVSGPDAEALAMVVEKASRAVLGGEKLGGAHAFPAWEALLMRFVYKNAYAKQAGRRNS